MIDSSTRGHCVCLNNQHTCIFGVWLGLGYRSDSQCSNHEAAAGTNYGPQRCCWNNVVSERKHVRGRCSCSAGVPVQKRGVWVLNIRDFHNLNDYHAHPPTLRSNRFNKICLSCSEATLNSFRSLLRWSSISREVAWEKRGCDLICGVRIRTPLQQHLLATEVAFSAQISHLSFARRPGWVCYVDQYIISSKIATLL